MSARIPMHLRLLSGAAAFVAVLAMTGCDDSAKVKELQEKLAEKDKQVAALESRIADLESNKPTQYLKPDKDDEYATAVAGAALDALLAGDVAAIRGTFSSKLQKGVEAMDFYNAYNQKIDSVHEWVTRWNAGKYKSYKIEKVVQAPMKDEFIIQGALFTKGTNSEDVKAGSFSITLVKDIEKGKFLLDAASAK
jgi:outer membrane murein-binding lipoprotein Lpp